MNPEDSMEPLGKAPGTSFVYDAFASYATDPDGQLVRTIEVILEGFHRRPDVPKDLVGKLELCVDGRDFKFPRSKSEMDPTSTIEQVIRAYQQQCRALVVFGGPAVRAHPWIGREIEWWQQGRPDGPIYFAYTHGRYPDPAKTAEYMPSSLIERGGPDNSSYFDMRGFHRNSSVRKFFLAQSASVINAITSALGMSPESFPRLFAWSRSSSASALGDVRVWTSVRSFDEEVCRMAAQLFSDKIARTLSAADLSEAYVSAELKAKSRRAKWTVVSAAFVILTLLAGWIVWDRLDRDRRVVDLASEAQTEIDNQQFERAMRLALTGLPGQQDVFWAPGWSDTDVRILRAKLAGAASLSAFKAEIPEGGHLTSATFSPDGDQILTASESGVSSIWDMKSMSRIASCRQTDVVSSKDRKNGQHKSSLDWVRDSQFSKDGRRVVSVGGYGIAWIWSPSDKGCQHRLILSGHVDDVRTGSFSPDGKLVVTTSDDDTVRIWNSETGGQLVQLSLPGKSQPPDDYTTSAEFSPDGKSLVVTRSDGLIAIADTVKYAVSPLRDKGTFVWRARFSPDSKKIVTAFDDGSVLLWDVAQRTSVPFPKQFLPVVDASFSPDGRLVVTAGADRTVRIWDVTTLEQRFVFTGHTQSVTRSEFSRDGKVILSSSDDGTARIWDAVTNVDQFTIRAHARSIVTSALSQDGKYFVTTSTDKKAKIWRLTETYDLSLINEFDSEYEDITSASFSPKGPDIALTYSDGRVSLGKISGSDAHDLANIQTAGKLRVKFDPSGNQIVLCSDAVANGNFVWNIDTGKQTQLQGATRIRSVDIDPGGTRIVLGSDDHSAGIWDAGSGAKLYTLPHDGSVTSVHFSSDGTRLVTTSIDGTARVWNTSTGAQLKKLVAGDGRDVNDGNFSRDGTRLVTASGDHTVRVWDTQTGAQIIRFEMDSTARSAIFTLDGTHILATSDEGFIKVFDARWTTNWPNLAERVCTEKLKGIAEAPLDIGPDRIFMDGTGTSNPCARPFAPSPL